MPTPQSFQNHTKLDALHHFVITPIVIANFAIAIGIWGHHHEGFPYLTAWWIILSFGLILLSLKMRLYALRNQDRLIRLEERLRLTALLPASEHTLLHSLTTSQLIALRFASDAELPALARRAASEDLTSRQIKQAIATWRPDHSRV